MEAPVIAATLIVVVCVIALAVIIHAHGPKTPA